MMIIMVSLLIMPPFLVFLLVSHIKDQYIEGEHGEDILVETKAEAQRAVLKQILHNPISDIYLLFAAFCIFSIMGAYNVGGLADWMAQ